MKKIIHQIYALLLKRSLHLIAAIIVLFILHGCKKNDFSTVQPTHEADFVQQFFTLKHPVNDTIAKFIAKLKVENGHTGFVDKLPANCGLPVWDKLLLKAQNNHPAFAAGDGDDITIVIPLTNTNASLSGVLVAQPVADSFSIKCYTNNWLYNTCHAAVIDTNYANESLAFFMYMENQTFGTQTFYHIPAALIADEPALPDSNGTKTVTIADVTPAEGFIINTVCIDITCPPSIAIGCMPKTVCISVPGDGAPAGGGDGTPGGGNTGTGGGQSGGGSGGNGNGPGGSTTCPLTTNVTWYGLMPPPNPCEDNDPKDANGFYASRILELKQKLIVNPFALAPCDSLNIVPYGTFGPMWQEIANFQMPVNLNARLDSINNLFANPELTQLAQQTLAEADGGMVNCDFFPVHITHLPNGFTSQSLLEYFRTHINSFITPGTTASSFNPYGFNYIFGGQSFSDTLRFNSPYQNSVGSLVHIHILGDDGTVILSDYNIQHAPPVNHESQRFIFTTLSSPLDNYHPVAGNRAFGMYNSISNPDEYTFYIMGVDRTYDWMSTLLNSDINPAGNIVFDGGDALWKDIQQNFINYINSLPGGHASYFAKPNIIARPQWNDVRRYLKKEIDFNQLKALMGC